MRAIVISTNFRNTDNWMSLFTRLISEGGVCEAVYLSWAGDPSVKRMDELSLPIRYQEDIPTLGRDGLALPQLRALLDRVVDETIDVVFLCDMQSYPSAAIFGILCERSRRPMVIGLQHGLFQSWWLYNQSFCADHLLCFGERHRTELLPSLRGRARPVGLPKLDALKAIESQEHGYILYLAQRVPEAAPVVQLLGEVEQVTGLPVVVRNHPQYTHLIEHRSSLPVPMVKGRLAPEQSYLDLLANANWVMTPHSTAGLEALYLHKPVVLLPNHGLTAWGGYPGVATDMSVGAVLAALDRARTRHPEIAMFLDDVLGGRRFDHTQRAVQALDDLVRGNGSFSPPLAASLDFALKSVAQGAQVQACTSLGLEDMAWLFRCDNHNRGIVRQNFDEASLLWRAARMTAGPILEIGRRHGGSTALLLAAGGARPLVSIDISPEHHEACDLFFAEVEAAQPGRLNLMIGDSRVPLGAPHRFGLLFIDGDHTYEGVRADTIAHWGELSRHDGRPALVVYHDAVPNPGLSQEGRLNHCEGVRRFCDELMAVGCAIAMGSAGSSLVLEKTGELPAEWVFEARKKALMRRDDVVELVRQGGVGIELGVAEGFLSERFLQHKVLSHLYSIDMYAGDRGHDDDQYRRAIARLVPFRDANTLVKLRFDDALHLFPDEYFDFIYVDGYAHTGEEAGATFRDWYPKLKPGGIMAGDDYCPEWPLVVEAVDRFLALERLPLNVIDCREDVAYSKYPTWYTVKPSR